MAQYICETAKYIFPPFTIFLSERVHFVSLGRCHLPYPSARLTFPTSRSGINSAKQLSNTVHIGENLPLCVFPASHIYFSEALLSASSFFVSSFIVTEIYGLALAFNHQSPLHQMTSWLIIAATLLCLPCIMVFLSFQKTCDAQSRAAKERRKNAPKPLPRTRRELSVSKPNTRPQTGSPFLQKLPPEIRAKIYHEVLGGETLHLIPLPERVAHVRCRATSGTDPLRTCMPERYSGQEIQVSSLDLALLQSCRQIYTEAIPILYTTNTFDIDDPSILLYLARTILPHRLESIRYLHFTWEYVVPPLTIAASKNPNWFPRDDQTWEAFWDVVGRKMPELRVLVLVVRTQHPKLDWRLEEGWVRPLLEVRGLKEFRLEQEFKFDSAVRHSTEFEPFRQRLQDIMCANT